MEKYELLSCPNCRNALRQSAGQFACDACRTCFSTTDGIPDLISAEGGLEQASFVRRAYGRFFDLIAPLYESTAWYQLTLNLSGARGNSIETIADFLNGCLSGVTGTVLDVACGTATYSRRIALPTRAVYGIDLSFGMLRQGLRYLGGSSIDNVWLARANVMALPFGSAIFDGATCAGSIHLFPDPAAALREVRRTMKEGAPLAVQTFLPKKQGRRSVKARTGFHEYEPDELMDLLQEAGFGGLSMKSQGTVLYASGKRPKAGA